MAGEEFRLPGSSYDDLVNIIVAYGTREESDDRPGDVGKLNAVHAASSTRNNAFLTDIGVLKGEKEKLVTRRGRALARALVGGEPAEVRAQWRQVVAKSEFLQNLVSAVKLRDGMTRASLQGYISHVARLPRNKPTLTGADAVIDILKASGLLIEDGGELIANLEDLPDQDAVADTVAGTTAPANLTTAEVSLPVPAEPRIVIQVQVRCTADEVEDLGPRLKKLLQDIAD